MNEIEKLIKQYLDYLEIEKNKSPRTRANYGRYLGKFVELSGVKNIRDISEDKIRAFRIKLGGADFSRGGEKKTLKKITQSYYVIVLRNFLKYLMKRDYKVVSPEKIELPKIPQRQIQIMDTDDLRRLLAAPKGLDIKTLRDRAILETLFATGARVSELAGLDRYMDFDRGELTIRGKGDKLRVVFLSEEAKSALKAYLEKRFDAEPALFVSFTKSGSPKVIGRLTTRSIERLMKHYAAMAGIPRKVTPHMLRHQFGTDLLMNGADLRSVQELLGHANVSTTQIYTHVTNKELKEIHRAFHAKRRKS